MAPPLKLSDPPVRCITAPETPLAPRTAVPSSEMCESAAERTPPSGELDSMITVVAITSSLHDSETTPPWSPARDPVSTELERTRTPERMCSEPPMYALQSLTAAPLSCASPPLIAIAPPLPPAAEPPIRAPDIAKLPSLTAIAPPSSSAKAATMMIEESVMFPPVTPIAPPAVALEPLMVIFASETFPPEIAKTPPVPAQMGSG